MIINALYVSVYQFDFKLPVRTLWLHSCISLSFYISL